MEKEKQDKIKKIREAAGVIALSVGSGVIGYKIAEMILKNNYDRSIQLTFPPEIQLKYDEINSNSCFKRKIDKINECVNSNDWISRVGSILVLFSELESLLDIIILKKTPVKNPKRNLIKKIKSLETHNAISKLDAYLLSSIVPIRNKLIHGNYTEVTNQDIKGSYTIIVEFISKQDVVEIAV